MRQQGQGLALLVRDTYYVQPANYWINTGAATWGWWQLILGVIVLAAGFGIMSGAAWARWLGIILILIDLWIIHSLFVHRRESV